LYHPDPERSWLIKGTVVGEGNIFDNLVYLVNLDRVFQGYIKSGTAFEQYISTVIVSRGSVKLDD
jgi:hypothetical protein